ncbi:acyltransferase [Chlorogloeopsis sp. ULAP01]|uniref:acyltransferase n=1 Tax=Chlorogloeopsis sp. ULAP01 TaxID=3056483 RepID=UPI0025AABFDB|nr:acyltransferase [Chlorogloeopsis sp. ULAP01]MDM9383169.1 acyltransferase [Chlorogloeopsis sp. ULAP01]
MNRNSQKYPSKWQRVQETILFNLSKGIPTSIGVKLRNLLYRNIFAKIGKSVRIQYGVEFIEPSCIEIGNNVAIFRGVNINANGHQNNKIYLADGVVIDYGVDIRSLINTSIYIDKDTFIGPYVCMAGPGNIKIGKNCLIASHTGIFANNHIYSDPTQSIESQGVTCQGIVIEDDCWLGSGVKVLDGVTIGKGSVIGAGSVVTKDIPAFSIAVGVPARVIKSRKAKEFIDSRLQGIGGERQPSS